MKHERNFEPMRREEPDGELPPVWSQIIFWGVVTVFSMAFYVGAFNLLMWLLS